MVKSIGFADLSTCPKKHTPNPADNSVDLQLLVYPSNLAGCMIGIGFLKESRHFGILEEYRSLGITLVAALLKLSVFAFEMAFALQLESRN